jgi:hypothetical protein
MALMCTIVVFIVGLLCLMWECTRKLCFAPMPIQKSVLQTSLYVTTVSAGFLIGSANLQAVPHPNGRMKHSEQAFMGPHCWRKLWKSLTRIIFTGMPSKHPA